jgi:hypothetical protein
LQLNVRSHITGNADGWLEETGEVDLVGGWAEISLSAEFSTLVDTSNYQVFLTSYDAVNVFVQNRTSRSFEIHVLPAQGRKSTSASRCAYRVLARSLIGLAQVTLHDSNTKGTT